jgi:mono/diheme cytochrome c family protein
MTVTARRILSLSALTIALAMPVAAASQDDAQIKKGQEIYAAQKCSTCHQIAGKGKASSVLDGVGKKLTADEIRQWIVNPKEMTAKTQSKKKPVMPAKWTKMPAADVDALTAYMLSLK